MHLPDGLVEVPVGPGMWERFFTVAPLVVVGTLEPDGGHDLAPKHLVTPLSWEGWFGFVCAPTHRTWDNAIRTGSFTVSWLRPGQVLHASLSAAPREEDGDKPALRGVPTFPARKVEGVHLAGCPLHLECSLDRVIGGFGPNGLLIGKVEAILAERSVLREDDRDDADLLHDNPLLVYVHPMRFAVVDKTHAFPVHEGFKR